MNCKLNLISSNSNVNVNSHKGKVETRRESTAVQKKKGKTCVRRWKCLRKDFERPDCHYNTAQSKRPNVFISVGSSLFICDILASWIPLLRPGPDCPHPFSVDQLTVSSLRPGLSDVFMTNETASLGLYTLFSHWLPPGISYTFSYSISFLSLNFSLPVCCTLHSPSFAVFPCCIHIS